MRSNNYKLIVLLLMVSVACQQEEAKPREEQGKQESTAVELSSAEIQQAGITTGKASLQTMHEWLKVNGEVDVPPQNIVSISFPMGGYLKSTKLLPGMHVNRGEVIGIIEDQSLIQLQQDYLVARNRYEYLEIEFKRQQELHENKVNAEKVFQQTESEYKSQQVLVRALEEKLSLIGINAQQLSGDKISRSVPLKSPINGFVSRVNVNIGKYVNPTDVLFELINPDDMHAALTIFEKDMPKIKIGQKVKVSFVDEPSVEYDCEIILATKNVDEGRSGIVHCHFDKIPKNLLPGMFLNASVQLGEIKAYCLPEEAVVSYGGRQFIFIATDGRQFRMQEVKLGIKEKGQVSLSDFQPELAEAQIVLKNAYALLGKLKNSAEEE